MKQIVEVHFPDVQQKLVQKALEVFYDLREVPGIKKKPSTSELVDWIKLLMADDLAREVLLEKDSASAVPPLCGALVKNEQDASLLERLAFMMRRQNR
jgi:MoxR-like ATPase